MKLSGLSPEQRRVLLAASHAGRRDGVVSLPHAWSTRAAQLQPPTPEERIRELEKKLAWERMENEKLRKDNSSLRTQLRKHYPR